jgi:hypothetical protein
VDTDCPSWPGGVDATSRRYREASAEGADGVVVQDQQILLILSNHPVCAASDASLFHLTGAATPPG